MDNIQDIEKTIKKYMESLTEKERVALEIAKDHLESSFDIERSVGYIEFKKNNPE
jgi:hypothetical protein